MKSLRLNLFAPILAAIFLCSTLNAQNTTFESEEIVRELLNVLDCFGITPHIFTLCLDESTLIEQNLSRELYYQTAPQRVLELYHNYNWDIGQKIQVMGKQIEEVAADIVMHLEKQPQKN